MAPTIFEPVMRLVENRPFAIAAVFFHLGGVTMFYRSIVRTLRNIDMPSYFIYFVLGTFILYPYSWLPDSPSLQALYQIIGLCSLVITLVFITLTITAALIETA